MGDVDRIVINNLCFLLYISNQNSARSDSNTIYYSPAGCKVIVDVHCEINVFSVCFVVADTEGRIVAVY